MGTTDRTQKKVPRKPLTDADRDEIVRQAQAKAPVTEIAAMFGCNIATIYNALARRGVKPPWKADRFTEKQKAEMCALALDGTPVKELATRYGCTTSNMHVILSRRGVRVPHPLYRLTDDQKADICRMYQAGESIKSLMARFDTDQSSVRRYLELGGIPLRPRIKKERKQPDHNCIHCGSALRATEGHRKRCQPCARAANAAKESRRRTRLSDGGDCQVCGKPRDGNSDRRCLACLEKQRQKRGEAKRRCMAGYGGVCKCCGTSIPEFLTIDHVDNDGAEMRRTKAHGGNGTGENIYRWAIRNGFPSSLQCLCMNCQWGKRLCGVCPCQQSRTPPEPLILTF